MEKTARRHTPFLASELQATLTQLPVKTFIPRTGSRLTAAENSPAATQMPPGGGDPGAKLSPVFPELDRVAPATDFSDT